ncbi:MAG TPA: SDR family NAD(P)-dependent oxidoreductase [Ignavibacteria bacterium]|nr:SDR family NAD(P)-dependent oxidoreductase [Ignavibacteria bacterium]
MQVHELKLEDLQTQLDLNLKSAFLSIKYFLPNMIAKNKGRIINVGARQGLHGVKGVSAYAASKAALINFTQSLAEELKETNINANIIIPSVIDTEANRKSSANENFSTWVSAESLGNVIKFLSSDESKDINGAVIPVYGKS